MKNSEIDIYNEAALNTLSQMIKAMIAEKNYCKMIEEHNCEMNNRKSISKYNYLEYLPFKIQWKLKNELDTHSNNKNTIVLDINTSERLRGKAYKFMNIFIKCISKMGGDVYVDSTENNDNTMFTLLESRYKC